MPNRPTLLVISGPPGTGKSTLARVLAEHLGCPAVIRDEIKQGMVLNAVPSPDGTDNLNFPARDAFFDTITVLLKAGVTVVAESAFQDRLWRPGLEPLTEIASIRVIRCTTPTGTIVQRITQRTEDDAHRAAHADHSLLAEIAAGTYVPDGFVGISLDLPTLLVDTSDGYIPGIKEIIAFAQPPKGR
ncbi:AAA family ATPase [Streptomyces sp. NRRL F-5727]|uniref:AAA family ATPase n=1 Tax=Streptomyces sp. NRRL F-5727 TaxID=1463871 RepID=UPI0004CB32BA|nr:ATP-binding protein [Streptomyces sp. NRRL F-5727]